MAARETIFFETGKLCLWLWIRAQTWQPLCLHNARSLSLYSMRSVARCSQRQTPFLWTASFPIHYQPKHNASLLQEVVTYILASILVCGNLVMCIPGTGHWSLVSSLISGPWDPVCSVSPVPGRERKVPVVIIFFLLSLSFRLSPSCWYCAWKHCAPTGEASVKN